MKHLVLLFTVLALTNATSIETKCVKGYLFVIATNGAGMSMVQVWQPATGNYNYTSHPVKCKVEKKDKR